MQGDQVKELFQTKVLWSLVILCIFFLLKTICWPKTKTKQKQKKNKNQTNKQKEKKKKNKTKNKNQPSDCRVSISARLLSIKWGTGAGYYTPLTKN